MKRFAVIFTLLFVMTLTACGQPPRVLKAQVTDESQAAVSVFAYEAGNEPSYGLLYLGHAFLSFENRSDAAFTIGAITLEPGQSMSLGNWGMTRHFGTWYNVESKYIDAAGKYAGRVSVTKSLPLETLDAINAYLKENDRWTPTTNCARFASDIFNLAGGDAIVMGGLATPSRLADAIRAFDAFEIDRPITGYGKVGYADKQGGFAEYEYAA